MPCHPFKSSDGRVSGIFCTTPEYEYVHEGRTWRFEFGHYCGPWPIRKDGQPFKRSPGIKSKFWVAFNAWWAEQHRDQRTTDGNQATD